MGSRSSKAVVTQVHLLQLSGHLSLAARLFFYISALALVAAVLFLVMRCYEKLKTLRTRRVSRGTERDPLWTAKNRGIESNYGTSGGVDLERGDCSKSKSSCSSSSSSSSELYDGKLCVICYDEERNCFFVPCGQCATCYVCAQRIYSGENITCPVCRRMIRKVRRLFAP